MRILAVDIGGLTQDILLFDTTQAIENCVKMVMPSPTYNLARKIREATMAKRPVFFTGVNMGGGPSKRALASHLKSGLKAYATPSAAATFDDDPEKVKEMGVCIISEDEAPGDVMIIHTRDIDLGAMQGALAAFEVDYQFDAVAVAVLDHGAAPPGISDRLFRFQHLEEVAQKNRKLIDFAYLADEIPDHLTRMKAVVESLDRSFPLLVMDTPIAAAIGAGEDPQVAGHVHRVITNVGNFHTLAFHLEGETILGFFEHHTRLLDSRKIDYLISRLISGDLRNEEVYNDEGHGCLVLEPRAEIPFVAVTGPQRDRMSDSELGPYYAAPHGDMMLTGCFGLIRAFAQKVPEWQGEIEQALQGP